MKTEEKIFNYIKFNQGQNIFVEKIIATNYKNNNDEKIMNFAKWICEFVEKAEDFSKQ